MFPIRRKRRLCMLLAVMQLLLMVAVHAMPLPVIPDAATSRCCEPDADRQPCNQSTAGCTGEAAGHALHCLNYAGCSVVGLTLQPALPDPASCRVFHPALPPDYLSPSLKPHDKPPRLA